MNDKLTVYFLSSIKWIKVTSPEEKAAFILPERERITEQIDQQAALVLLNNTPILSEFLLGYNPANSMTIYIEFLCTKYHIQHCGIVKKENKISGLKELSFLGY